MDFMNVLYRARSRAVWADPVRTVRTLEGFSKTETDGGQDLVAAARRVTDPKLKAHLERHAREELKHGDLFRQRAQELRSQLAAQSTPEESDKLYDLSRLRKDTELDSHGFFQGGVLDERGEIAYVAMLNVAEQNASSIFKIHRDLNRHDPETSAIFEEILRDEQYHVAYTARYLKEWKKEGRQKEVKEALAYTRGSRFLSAWKRAGLRAAGGFGRTFLLLVYFTLVIPFALFARMQRAATGWRTAPAGPRAPDRYRSSY